MQDEKTGKIAYGAMMIALFVGLAGIAFFIPIVGIFTAFFIPLPMVLYRLKYNRTASLFVMGAGIVLSMFVGTIAILPLTFVLGLVGFIIGDTVQSGKTKLYTLMATGLTFLTTLTLIYVAMVLYLKINLIDIVMDGLKESQEQFTSLLIRYGEMPENFSEQLNDSITFYETSIPSTFIIGMFVLAFVFVTLNLGIVKRLGHPVQSFPPFHTMKLPLIMVWYYLLVLLAGIFFDIKQGTQAYIIYTNAMILLRFLFLIQGVSFIHYFMKETKLPKWMTVISTIFALLLSPITTLLGVLDVGINIRAWIGKNKVK